MARIVFISRSKIEDFPRLRLIPRLLIELGHHVVVVSPSSNLTGIASPRLEIVTIPNTVSPNPGTVFKLLNWYRYRRQVLACLNSIKQDGTLLSWYSSADSALPLIFSRATRMDRILFQINELYDAYPVYKFLLKVLLSSESKVIVPEVNRAILMKYWFRLNERPFILPNKSLELNEKYSSSDNLEVHIERIQHFKSQGFKIIIFQGMIEPRRDLSYLMTALSTISEKVMMVFMGKDFGMIKKYRLIYDNIYVLPFQIAPNHLQITKLADVGILYYDHSELNQIYCAPNKIWEYSAFGIPFISNELPGLNFATDTFKAGLQLDFKNQSSVHLGLTQIFFNYDRFASNSTRMFNSIDMKSLISRVVKWVE